MTKLLIRGGRVIDPANKLDKVADIGIVDHKIVHSLVDFAPDKVIDAKGLIVCPGLIDLSVHLREPGYEHKGTIDSETRAAAKGGITTVCCTPNTLPVIDTPAVVDLIQEKAKKLGFARVLPLGALTEGLKGEQLSEMQALKAAGCIGVSNSFYKIKDNALLRRCFEYAATFDLTIFINPIEHSLAVNGCAHEGSMSTRLGLPPIPETAETVAVATIILLAEQTQARVHFNQLSTGKAVAMIKGAQQKGLAISADVAAYQLHLSEQHLENFNSLYHVIPPLRSETDQQLLREGVATGVVAALCSNHQPHEAFAKLAPFAATEPGISGVETLLSLGLQLVEEKVLDLNSLIERLTSGPAKILGINAGTLTPGQAADICIFDPKQSWTPTESTLISCGKNTPFLQQALKGQVQYTLLNGKIVYTARE